MECDQVIAPGAKGQMGFLPGHIPLITALSPGVLTVHKGNHRYVFAVGTGFAEIEADAVRVLTSTCEDASDIDVQQARTDLQEAEASLAELSPTNSGFADQLLRYRLNRARLDAHARRPQ